jgi:hypothetical protein
MPAGKAAGAALGAGSAIAETPAACMGIHLIHTHLLLSIDEISQHCKDGSM